MNILPALLNTEPYADVIGTLINKGEEMANALEDKEDEAFVKWTNLINLLQELINEQNDM